MSFFYTEASKLVMSYVAAVCEKGEQVNSVKEQLLQSNPVLEGEDGLSALFNLPMAPLYPQTSGLTPAPEFQGPFTRSFLPRNWRWAW